MISHKPFTLYPEPGLSNRAKRLVESNQPGKLVDRPARVLSSAVFFKKRFPEVDFRYFSLALAVVRSASLSL